MSAAEVLPKTHRGTTNGNARGSSDDRRRRREWLVETYRADVDVRVAFDVDGVVLQVTESGDVDLPDDWHSTGVFHACRCYRCGQLLSVHTVTVDRITPGAHGGTYRRNNIRPACGRCNSETGATVRVVPRKRKRS